VVKKENKAKNTKPRRNKKEDFADEVATNPVQQKTSTGGSGHQARQRPADLLSGNLRPLSEAKR
jgi:organic hydroperoxide reductase OsmC/OhrA